MDRDGTINEEVGYLDSLDKMKIIPGAYEAIRLINESGMKVVVISNQAGVARGLFTEKFVKTTNDYLQTVLRQQGAYINNFYYCPHHPTEGIEPYRQICECRKPAPGMLLKAALDLNIDLSLSYLVGDRFLDMEAARKAGVKGILVKTGYGSELLQDDGPNKSTEENRPDFIAEDILEAVRWILDQVAFKY
ncbi:MAG: HAD family hydrolase [Deltaproteobacteria bacterium]|nr:HAD family hydrolase [Deltaproteobacteria bacterium]